MERLTFPKHMPSECCSQEAQLPISESRADTQRSVQVRHHLHPRLPEEDEPALSRDSGGSFPCPQSWYSDADEADAYLFVFCEF